MERVTALIAELKADGHAIRYIDAGGGLGIDYSAAEFDAAAEAALYATAMSSALDGLGLHLLLEPGRFIVGQAGGLLTRVLYVKKNGEKTFVITDAGMNDLIRPSLYRAHHEILPVALGSGKKASGKVDVVGPVCESGDFFARDRMLAAVKPGDLVLLLDAGAYGMSLSSNYNSRPRPAEVLVEGKKARIVRRRETMKDLLGPEIL
jgi:diaminopimelate decarboxylase